MENRIAKLNVTYKGANGDLPDGVAFDASSEAILEMAEESIRNGDIPGVTADEDVNLDGFEVVRFSADDGSGLGDRVFVRPKTPFGM